MINMFKSSITKEEIELLPLFSFEGNISVIETAEDAVRIATMLKKTTFLGFDTETRPAFKKGVEYQTSLIQLSTADNAYLFRINKCGFVKELRQLLSSRKITKIGVGITDDIKKLRKIKDFKGLCFVDLQKFAENYAITDKSFLKLMAIILGVRVSKRQRVSNWDESVLTEGQLRYAATDAWGALKMYRVLLASTSENS